MASHSPIYPHSRWAIGGCYHARRLQPHCKQLGLVSCPRMLQQPEPGFEPTTLQLSNLQLCSCQKQSKTKRCRTVFFFWVNDLKMTNLSARGNGRRQWDNGEVLRVCGREDNVSKSGQSLLWLSRDSFLCNGWVEVWALNYLHCLKLPLLLCPGRRGAGPDRPCGWL